MARGKREPEGHRGGDARNRYKARGSNDDRCAGGNGEEDPLRDLRPHNDYPEDQADDEYVWPDLTDEYSEHD